jgi:acyl dehydratase
VRDVLWYEDFELSCKAEDEWVSRRRTVTETDAVLFTSLTGIIDPVFTDDIFARENVLGGRVVPGPMVMTYAMGLTDELGAGSVVAALGINNARFVAPVRPQHTIWVKTRVVNARARRRAPCSSTSARSW